MKKLLTLLVLFLCGSALAQLPTLVRNPYSTNNAHIATNTLYLSELMGSDTAGAWQWGNPAMPVKTLTNAIVQANLSCVGGAATIFAYPETFNCISNETVNITNLDLTLLAWGATFRCFTTNNSSQYLYAENCPSFRQFGGYWNYSADFVNNQGFPFLFKNVTNVYLYGLRARCRSDFVFFNYASCIGRVLYDGTDISSAWDTTQITMTGQGTNTVFDFRNCIFRKDDQEIQSGVWNAVNASYVGSLNMYNCMFKADNPNFTNNMSVIKTARTNDFMNCTWTLAGSGTLAAFDSFTTGGATPRQHRFENCTFYPDFNFYGISHSSFQYASTSLSNINVRGTAQLLTNAPAGWPAQAQVGGGAVFVNSNSYIYLLQSSPGSTAWVTTNLIGATP